MVTPLQGIKVLELARTLAGPVSGQILGDLGAEVIKVEQPRIGDEARRFTPPDWNGESCYYLSSNRNKKSITVDLKSKEGRKIIYELVKQSDVVIENFRTGGAEKLGVDYKTLSEINEKLVYLSISGFGRTGPEKNRPGYDILIQGYSGIMSTTGEEGKPYKVGPSVVDLSTGILGALGVMAALLARDKIGEGQFVDCSLLDSQMMMLNHLATGYFATNKSPKPMGQGHNTLVPYQVFRAKDRDIIIAAANDNQWYKTCESLDWNDLLHNEKFKLNENRVKYRSELEPILRKRIAEMDSNDIFQRLDAAGVPCGPINSVGEVVTSPQAVARNMMVDIDHPKIKGLKTPAFPVKLSKTPFSVRLHPPELGENTSEVLTDLGYSETVQLNMREKGII